MDGWIGMDGIGWYPGGRGYRAPYGANKKTGFLQLSFKKGDPA